MTDKVEITTERKCEQWIRADGISIAWIWHTSDRSEWYISPIHRQPEEFKKAINDNCRHYTEQAAVKFAVQTAEKFYNTNPIETEISTETESP